MSDSFNDSFTIQELRTSASISFSTHGTNPLDYSSDIDDDVVNSSLLKLPISPVSQSQEEEEDKQQHVDHDEHEGRRSTIQEEECTGITAAAQLEVEPTLMEAEATSNLPNELSISTSQTSHCNEKNSNGQSPLSISASNCFLDGMKLLIERGADINLQDAFGRTTLHLTCENVQSSSHHDCIDYLLSRGANSCIQDLHGRTPLHIAANEGCVECINKLMEHGQDPNVRDSSGEIPLHIATRMMHLECMEALSPSCEDSTSSVESTSSVFQFENETSFYHHCDRSRSMQEMTSGAAGKESWHDSGYFTARGIAWTKSKYHPSNKIEESVSLSTLQSESDSDAENNAGGELSSTPWAAAQSLEIILRLALGLIDLFLSWLRNHVVSKSSLMMQANNDVSPGGGQEESCCSSMKEPPDHIKEAMDRYKQQHQDI